MTDTLQLPIFSPGVKRTHDGTPVESHSMASPRTPSPAAAQAIASPTPTSDSSLSELAASTPRPESIAGNPVSTQSHSTQQPATKKPKLTGPEKEVEKAIQRMIKEDKAKLKAEEKAKKDDEKRVKEEERKKKAEEREEAKRLKDVEKAEKEAEKAKKQKAREEEKAAKDADKAKKEAEKTKKEEEKLKKDRQQTRMSAFFISKPGLAGSPPGTPDTGSIGVASRRSSIASIDMSKPMDDAKGPTPKSKENPYLPPFFIKPHTELAPSNRFLSSDTVDKSMSDVLQQNPELLSRVQRIFRPRRARPRYVVPIKDLMATSNGSSNAPIDLTSEFPGTLSAIQKAPFKILHFQEDVRPPYRGTYTKVVSPRASRKLSRVPTHRGLPGTDYDYDSEAEWEAPDVDDEDLERDSEEEEEDDVDDMDDFLDDENDIKRTIASGDNEPVSTGLCWEGSTDLVVADFDLADYRMQVMHDDQRLPINPYSIGHWSVVPKAEKKATDTPTSTTMQPPRLPLSDVNVNTTSPMKAFLKIDSKPKLTENAVAAQAQCATIKTSTKKAAKPVKMVPDELMTEFKAAIQGSDLNKIAIVEILKKQFSSCSKDSIKTTLDIVAERQGVKEADKRWVLR